MVPIPETVAISLISQPIDRETHTFKSTEMQDKAAVIMLGELARWTAALASLRV